MASTPERINKRYVGRRGEPSIASAEETLSSSTKYDTIKNSLNSSIVGLNANCESKICNSSVSVTTVKSAFSRNTYRVGKTKSKADFTSKSAMVHKRDQSGGRFSKWMNSLFHVFNPSESKFNTLEDRKTEQKNNNKSRKNKQKIEPDKRPLDDINIRKLIRLYSKHEYLYNPENYLYGNREIVEDCYNDIARSFPGYSGHEIHIMVEQLRNLFQREHNAIESMKRNYGEQMKPSIEYYDELAFLEPYLPKYEANARITVNMPMNSSHERTESGGICKMLSYGSKSKKSVSIMSSDTNKSAIEHPSLSSTMNNTQYVCDSSSCPYNPQSLEAVITESNQHYPQSSSFGNQYTLTTFPNTTETRTSTNLIDSTSSMDQTLSKGSNCSSSISNEIGNGQLRPCTCTEVKQQNHHYDNKQTPKQSTINNEIKYCTRCPFIDDQTKKNFPTSQDESDCDDGSSLDTVDTISGQNNVQVKMLCDMIKMELSDSPDYIYFDAKWRIIEILREVHKRQLVHRKSSPTPFCNDNSSEASSRSSLKPANNIRVSEKKTNKTCRNLNCPVYRQN